LFARHVMRRGSRSCDRCTNKAGRRAARARPHGVSSPHARNRLTPFHCCNIDSRESNTFRYRRPSIHWAVAIPSWLLLRPQHAAAGLRRDRVSDKLESRQDTESAEVTAQGRQFNTKPHRVVDGEDKMTDHTNSFVANAGRGCDSLKACVAPFFHSITETCRSLRDQRHSSLSSRDCDARHVKKKYTLLCWYSTPERH